MGVKATRRVGDDDVGLPSLAAPPTASKATAPGSPPGAPGGRVSAAGALRPALELLHRGGAIGVGGGDAGPSGRAGACRCGELADRRRLAGAVHADDEDHRRLGPSACSDGGSAARRAAPRPPRRARRRARRGLGARLEARARSSAVAGTPTSARDQRLLEPLPRLVVAGVERRRGELARSARGATSRASRAGAQKMPLPARPRARARRSASPRSSAQSFGPLASAGDRSSRCPASSCGAHRNGE